MNKTVQESQLSLNTDSNISTAFQEKNVHQGAEVSLILLVITSKNVFSTCMKSKNNNRFTYGTLYLPCCCYECSAFGLCQKPKNIHYLFRIFCTSILYAGWFITKLNIRLIKIRFLIFSNIRPGSNNVRLLNSAVINEFTMLTYRQPLNNRDR